MNRQLRNSFLLALAAFIWGIAFVAQREGGDIVGPYTFNCIRSIIGSIVLLPAILFLDHKGLSKKPKTTEAKRAVWLGGISCGIMLCFATNAQQVGMYYGTPAGKAGFLTACYILLVPILSIFLKKKCSWNIWIGVCFALVGLYLLCMNNSLKMQFSDLLVLTCALVFAFHILTIEHFAPIVDSVRMACIQFLTCGILTAIPMVILETGVTLDAVRQWAGTLTILDAWIPLLYAGVLSCGVAYTLQIIGQNGLNSTIASLVMSLESVFSVLAGWIILKERLSVKELMGCALIFVAIILAQLPIRKR